jgi:uncharacterized protein YjiS (DUF1127 family)
MRLANGWSFDLAHFFPTETAYVALRKGPRDAVQESTEPATVQAQGLATMNAYVDRDDIAIQRADSLSHYFQDDPDYMPHPEPEASHFFARLGKLFHWLAEFPKRQAVMDELASLSDHELSDIGLTRSDLPRVFDEQFAAERNVRSFAQSSSTVRPIPL